MKTAQAMLLGLGFAVMVMLLANAASIAVKRHEVDSISTRELRVVDAAGTPRVVISVDENNNPGLVIYNNKKPKIYIGLTGSGFPNDTSTYPVIGFLDSSGKKYQAQLHLIGTQSVLALRDDSFTNSITLASTPVFSSIRFWHQDHKANRIQNTIHLRSNKEQQFIEIKDRSGRSIWAAP